MESPGFFACFRIEAGDKCATAPLAADALDDLAFGDQWAARELPSVAGIRQWLVPHDGSRSCVESNDVQVRRSNENFVAVERQILFHAGTDILGQLSRVMPEFV